MNYMRKWDEGRTQEHAQALTQNWVLISTLQATTASGWGGNGNAIPTVRRVEREEQGVSLSYSLKFCVRKRKRTCRTRREKACCSWKEVVLDRVYIVKICTCSAVFLYSAKNGQLSSLVPSLPWVYLLGDKEQLHGMHLVYQDSLPQVNTSVSE